MAQRARILDAALAELGAGGLPALTLSRVLRRARMSGRTFHIYFEDIEDCVLALYRACAGQLAAELRGAWEGADPWPERVRAALDAALGFAVRQTVPARLLAFEAQAGGERLRAAQAASIEALAARLASGREHYPNAARLHPLTERVLVAGAVSVAGERLLAGRADQLTGLAPPLLEALLAPSLGSVGAARFARR